MVYESGFTTRRSYVSRPVITSYAVSYRSTPSYSYSYYTTPTRYYTGSYSSYLNSPIRYVSSPLSSYVYRSSISPVRTIRSTNYVVPRYYSYYSSTPSIRTYYPSISSYSLPSYTPYLKAFSYDIPPAISVTRPFRRASSICSYYLPTTTSNEAFETLQDETIKIRSRAQSLMRDIHTPVVRYSRSCTPFPIIGHEPTTQLALDSYVSRTTNPIRHVAKEVHNMLNYPDRPRRYLAADLDPDRPSRKYTATKTLENLFGDKIEEALNKRKHRKLNERNEKISESNIVNGSLEVYNISNKKSILTRETKQDITKPQVTIPVAKKTEEKIKKKYTKEGEKIVSSKNETVLNNQSPIISVSKDELPNTNLLDSSLKGQSDENEKVTPKEVNSNITDDQKTQLVINNVSEILETQSVNNANTDNQAKPSKNNDVIEDQKTGTDIDETTETQKTPLVEAGNQVSSYAIVTDDSLEISADTTNFIEHINEEIDSNQPAEDAIIESTNTIEKNGGNEVIEEPDTVLTTDSYVENPIKEYETFSDNELSEDKSTLNETIIPENSISECNNNEREEKLKLEQNVQYCEEEINRLAEIEKEAQQLVDSELASQAAELAEIARNVSEIAAQELEESKNLLVSLEKASFDEVSTISEEGSITSEI